MLRVVIAPDSFKESMTAVEAAAAMARGVRSVRPEAECVLRPMADGGEGTTAVLTAARGGRLVPVATSDALGRGRRATIGLLEGPGPTAVLEVAESVGLALIAPGERAVMASTSRGVADLVRAALDAGARRLVVGLGGSATNDAGAGLLVGLGARLLDASDHEVPPEPRQLERVRRIDLAGLDPRLREVRIDLACDVVNPLLGPRGASAVFGPQKGAAPAQVAELDRGLAALADALAAAVGRDVRDLPGAGAAGGLGAAFLALGATRHAGFDLVAEAAGLREALSGADLALTGEGSIDAQTSAGKAPAGVARLARERGVPVIAFAGRIGPGADLLRDGGVSALVPIVRAAADPATTLREGPANLTAAVENTMRLLDLGAALGAQASG